MKNLLLLLVSIFFYSMGIAQSSETGNPSNLKETISEQKIKVFPNPATRVVNILGLENSQQANISISDLSGNVVMQHQWAIRTNAVSIPIPNLNSGIYVVRINSKEQKVQTKFYKN